VICAIPGDGEKPIHTPHAPILNYDHSQGQGSNTEMGYQEWLKSRTLGLYCNLILKI
jgi:hypothetical protein